MEHGSEQLTDMAISEISRTSKKIVHDIENDNADSDAMAKESLNETMHLARTTTRLAEIASRSISKHWDGAIERSHEWNVDF